MLHIYRDDGELQFQTTSNSQNKGTHTHSNSQYLPETAPFYIDNESTIGPASAPPSSHGGYDDDADVDEQAVDAARSSGDTRTIASVSESDADHYLEAVI